MSTAKAKLHTEMARAGKKCEYETKQLPSAELPEGRLDVEFNKEDPMFACTLHMPDGYIIRSSSFRRKKDAEQDAALLALQKMGIPYEPGALHATPKELWDGLRRKVCLAFADQMVLSYKPLAEHFRAAVQRKGSRSDQVPVIVLTVLDAKVTSQCKAIDHLAENNPAHAAALVAMATAECPSLRLSDDRLWIRRVEPFSPELKAKLFNDQDGVNTPEESTCSSNGALSYEAVYISAFTDKDAVSINLTAAPNSYYLDTIAQELDVPDAGHVFMSRQIAKAPDGTRLFWGVREGLPSVSIPDGELVEQVEPVKQHPDLGIKDGPMEALRNPGGQTLRNERASFLVGNAVYGDAILATVGSTWQSEGRCIYEPYTLRSFRKLMLGRTPWGAYKIGRESLLVADLPKNYTCRAHWQGASPKSLLADFCQQHRLPEPQYTYSDSSNVEEGQSESDNKPQIPGSSRQESFHCKVEVSSPGSEAQRHCYQSDEKGFFRSRHDAIQSAALRTLTNYETWCGTGCLRNLTRCKSSGELLDNASSNGQTVEFEVIEGEDLVGDRPPPGSIVSIDYKVNLIQEGSGCNGSSSNRLEAQDDFKFELVEGAVISQVESCVSRAIVGQTLRFCISAEALGVLFQASSNVGEYQPGWVLEYIVTLLKFEEAMEDRIESSHFSPPLSKQRVEHARTLINDLEAKTLVDLGCGSGCLLEALLKEPNTLEHMVGIDISTKALNRGAKALSATLMKQDAHGIKSVTLYEGSISDLNPRLCCPDLATCIEVVEHMDPEPLSKLGESVLGKLAPRVWLVSTPNVEYNPIIRGLEWDPASNSLKKEFQQQQQQQQQQQVQVSKEKQVDTEIPNLRNHDHRFEWTRAEFREWASHLAAQYGYEVCYAGVGGDGADDDNSPGFATQIAILTRTSTLNQDQDRGPLCAIEFRKRLENRDEAGALASPLKERWQWNVPAAVAAAVL